MHRVDIRRISSNSVYTVLIDIICSWYSMTCFITSFIQNLRNPKGTICPEKSNCRNTPGSYACDCLIGYAGEECININECLKNPCRTNSECKDTDGSYDCPCITGFYESGSFCYNINECGDGTHACPENSACIDTTGSYDCRCNIGYSGESCVNIDECTAKTHTCRN